MKRIIIYFFLLILVQIPCSAAETGPVHADALNDGEYSIEVTSSSSMFRIVDCKLIVADGQMNAVMTLSGTGYEKLFMGTGDKASAAPDSECIYFAEDSGGKYTYTVPVEALDAEIDCAAWSIKKQKWYDRTLVFESSSLPGNAFAKSAVLPTACGIAIAVLIAAAAVITYKRKKKNGA